MQIPTLLRKAEHRALAALTLSGTVLDLGGDTNATYRKVVTGTVAVTSVNMDAKTAPDTVHDLEQPLPFANASYDHVLLINVLEHIYNYRQVLREAARVVRPEGSVVIVVPFLFPVHPSPHDYWRFTAETLQKECEAVGLTVETLTPLGSGVAAAQYVLIDRLMPFPIRAIGYVFLHPGIYVLDWIFLNIARLLKKKYSPADYALGYCVTARRVPANDRAQ